MKTCRFCSFAFSLGSSIILERNNQAMQSSLLLYLCCRGGGGVMLLKLSTQLAGILNSDLVDYSIQQSNIS